MEKLAFNIKLKTRIYRDGPRYIARCPVVGVITQGNTEEEVKRNLEEALQLFFDSCSEKGVLGLEVKQ